MIVRRIALNGFRNYDFETADFDAGTNVICGPNAQGKTNLLEAVYMLAMGRSFRTRFDKELVSFGGDSADILADVYSHGREQTVNLRLSPGRPKRILVNSVKKNAGELSDTVNAVLFCPDDLNLIKEGAAVRRRLMDNAICQIRPRYAEILSDFNKLYENKTRILKDWRDKPSLLDTLDEFSDGMARASAQLIRYRAAFSQRLQEAAAPIHRDFSDGLEELEITYKTVSTVRDPFASAKEIYYDICDHQEKHRQAELDSVQVTFYSADAEIHNRLVGAHHYEETLAGIKNALAQGLSVSINTPLCTLNRDYEKTLEFLHGLGVIYVTCSGLITTGSALGAASEALQLSSEELEAILRRSTQYCHENGMEIAFTSPGWLDEQVFEELNIPAPSCGA